MASEKLDEKDIFNVARKIDSPDARAEYLRQVCGADENLFERVGTLLQAYEEQASFLESPVAGNFSPTLKQPPFEPLGETIGPYKLLEQIGEGGFGIVFMADQQVPVRRRVALKIIKPGMDTRNVLARFEAELQALALMDHPNIARALDAGATDSGRPYFVMELVRGVPVTEYCDQNHLAVHERLELFVQVCHAVQHAHQKGIIHRDIKPSNILVAIQDGRPVPKVIDFGVAKAINQQLTQETIFTRFAEMIGTPLYMSPEQAEMTSLDIDTRSDIYSLGVVLYELLTGSTPFEKQRMKQAAFDEIRRIIREEEPPKPSTRISSLGDNSGIVAAHRHADPRRLGQLMRGDLDWIVMKALEKDRTRRYETANGLAMDVQRHLADEPVLAGPPSTIYRFIKFARRNRVALTTAILVSLAMVIGTIVSINLAIRARRAEIHAINAQAEESRQKDLAENARKLADEARAAEVEQRRVAEANFQKAREAVDRYFTLISESTLFDVPGLQPLRKQLLEAASQYYTGFANERANDPTALADLAVTSMRVAEINHAVNRNDDAIAAIDRALEAIEKLRRDFPQAKEQRRRLAGYWKGFRRTVGGTRLPKDQQAAFRSLTRLAETWETLAKEYPDQPAFQSDLAAVYMHLGDLVAKGAGAIEALKYFGKARDILEKLATAHPEVPEYRTDLARSYHSLSSQTRFSGRAASDTVVADLKALELREKLVEQFPRVAQYREDLAFSLSRNAGRLMNTDPAEAEKYLRRSHEIMKSLLAESTAMPVYVLRYSDACQGLGEMLRRRGELVEAESLLRESIKVETELIKSNPAEFASEIGHQKSAVLSLTMLLSDTNRPEEAEVFAQQGVAIMGEKAADLNAAAWDLVVSSKATSIAGRCGIMLAQKCVELAPQNGNAWNTLGVAHYRARDWKAALSAFDKSMEFRSGGDSNDWLFVAMAHWQLGEKELAKKWYKAAELGMSQALPKDEELERFRAEASTLMGPPDVDAVGKTDGVALGDLMVELRPQGTSYRIRGEAFASSGQWDRAESDFAKAIELGAQGYLPWYQRALSQCAKDDKPGFQATCAEMLKRFSQTQDGETADFVAWTCALGPDALSDFTPVVAVAEKAVQSNAGSSQFACCLGAILYRAGRFDEARQRLEEADQKPPFKAPGRSSKVYIWFFLAMAQQRLGHTDEAKVWLGKASDAMDHATKEHDAGTTVLIWNRRLTLKLLRHEAEELLGVTTTVTSTTTPEDKPAN